MSRHSRINAAASEAAGSAAKGGSGVYGLSRVEITAVEAEAGAYARVSQWRTNCRTATSSPASNPQESTYSLPVTPGGGGPNRSASPCQAREAARSCLSRLKLLPRRAASSRARLRRQRQAAAGSSAAAASGAERARPPAAGRAVPRCALLAVRLLPQQAVPAQGSQPQAQDPASDRKEPNLRRQNKPLPKHAHPLG